MVKMIAGAIAVALSLAFATTAAANALREQAIAMVEDAQAYIAEVGLEQALSTFNDVNETRFHQGELYIFAVDANDVHIALGAKPALVGKSLINVRDPDGNRPGAMMRDLVAKQKSGWVDYHWQNPTTGKIDQKSAYIERLEGGGFIGVGIYVED